MKDSSDSSHTAGAAELSELQHKEELKMSHPKHDFEDIRFPQLDQRHLCASPENRYTRKKNIKQW